MDLSIMLNKIRLKDFLSFGPEGIDLELLPLNVLIGPNASGKSNFIQALKILKAAPDKIIAPISNGGGAKAFKWHGLKANDRNNSCIRAFVRWHYTYYDYELQFSHTHDGYFDLRNELIAVLQEENQEEKEIYSLNYKLKGPKYKNNQILPGFGYDQDSLEDENFQFDKNQSVFAQLHNTQKYPEIEQLRRTFESIQIYEAWTMGDSFQPRKSQPVDMDVKYLRPDAANLAGVLNKFDNLSGDVTDKILKNMRKVYPELKKISIDITDSQYYLRFHEESLADPVPAIRQSDGVLRFLCILAILHNPDPPTLICLEEPEIGLHPDAIRILGNLLKEASKRTQLIVTTHSDLLVSTLTDTPESVVICNRDKNGTHMKRLESKKLERYLEDYPSLGQLWLQGELGGTL